MCVGGQTDRHIDTHYRCDMNSDVIRVHRWVKPVSLIWWMTLCVTFASASLRQLIHRPPRNTINIRIISILQQHTSASNQHYINMTSSITSASKSITRATHLHHSSITSTSHQHHSSITSTSHQHHINITSASHQHHISITAASQQHHINITSASKSITRATHLHHSSIKVAHVCVSARSWFCRAGHAPGWESVIWWL